jgi:hypothetical protein
VILIDRKPKCLSCGASPVLELASTDQEQRHHHHHHHHQHHHHHTERGRERENPPNGLNADAREEVVAKLRVLLPHWIEHNAEHAHSFRNWAGRAEDAGEGHLAAHIEEAARKIADANRDLEGLIEHIGETVDDHVHLHHDHSR